MRPIDCLKKCWSLCLVLFTLTPIGLTGCSWNIISAVTPTDRPALTAESIQSEITRLEAVLPSQKDASARAAMLYRLARLYSHPQNPACDYGRALNLFEEYARLNPAGAKSDEFQCQLALLKVITENQQAYEALKADFQKLKKENDDLRKESIEVLKDENQKLRQDSLETLKRENEDLREKFDNLSQENKDMQEVIEKLKHLDIRLEKKRKDIE